MYFICPCKRGLSSLLYVLFLSSITRDTIIRWKPAHLVSICPISSSQVYNVCPQTGRRKWCACVCVRLFVIFAILDYDHPTCDSEPVQDYSLIGCHHSILTMGGGKVIIIMMCKATRSSPTHALLYIDTHAATHPFLFWYAVILRLFSALSNLPPSIDFSFTYIYSNCLTPQMNHKTNNMTSTVKSELDSITASEWLTVTSAILDLQWYKHWHCINSLYHPTEVV